MDLLIRVIRREEEKKPSSPGLGLGWLLAIALGGGVLLFAAIGLLLTWRIKARAAPCTTRVYSQSGNELTDYPNTTPRQESKRRFERSDSSFSRISSRMSFPPVLPPLPTYNSFMSTGNRSHTSHLVDEEALRGPTDSRWSLRESWFSKDGWLGKSPTMASLVSNKSGSRKLTKPPPKDQVIEVQKKRSSQPTLHMSQTEPVLSKKKEEEEEDDEEHEEDMEEADLPRGRSRLPVQLPAVRTWATESDLRDILASTEQRLRTSCSRSPVKSGRGSPNKGGSPVKTPRSSRTGCSFPSYNGSPSKRNTQRQNNTPASVKRHSRTASITSIGSIAQSLIRQAAEELERPGGLSSPSRGRVQEWESQPKVRRQDELQQKQQKQQHRQQHQPQRVEEQKQPQQQHLPELELRRSLDSDTSSALSTLYSVDEPEEESRRPVLDDPFVERNRKGSRPQPVGPRPLRRAKTLGGLNGVDQSAVPAPLRTISVNAKLGTVMGGDGGSKRSVSWLHPPKETRKKDEEVKAKNTKSPDITSNRMLSPSPSSSSMVSVSVHSITTGTERDRSVTPKAQDFGGIPSSPLSGSATPPARDFHDLGELSVTSLPLDDPEALSILLSDTQPKRDLPSPPESCTMTGDDSNNIAPPYLPRRPKSRILAPIVSPALSRNGSVSSSIYDQDSIHEDQHTELSSRRMNGSTLSVRVPTVGSTVAELRRTNSVVSSYSVASLASAFLGESLTESPSVSNMRGGGFTPLRTNSRAAAVGNRNYLNLGGKNSPKNKKANQQQQQQQQQASGRKTRTVGPILLESKDVSAKGDGQDNKENEEGSGLRTVRFNAPRGPREPRLGSSLTVPLADAGRNSPRSATANTATSEDEQQPRVSEQQQRQRQRQSAQSAQSVESIYDKDGFLKNTPDGKGKGGQWRM